MNAEILCIRRTLLHAREERFDYFLVLDGKIHKSVEESIEANAPRYEVMVAFCECALHPETGGCIQQALTRSPKSGSRSRRRPHSHRARDSGGNGGDSADNDGGGDLCDCGPRFCLWPSFCKCCRLADAGGLLIFRRPQ
jgi:hypothetical protein